MNKKVEKKTVYVCEDEYEGCCVGTLAEILEWQYDNTIPYLRTRLFIVGDEVETLEVFNDI